MFLMIADEADQDGAKQFLVFAGVFFPSEALKILTEGVEKLRRKYGYGDGDLLKSSPTSKPKSVSSESHASIKNAILQLAANHECKICCYVVPHAIAKGQKHEDRMKYGTNTLLQKFDQFLSEKGNAAGIALFDRTSDYKQPRYFGEVYSHGIPWQDGSKKKLRNVVLIDNTGIGHSHLASVTDVVVGAFRFVANEPDKDKVGTVLTKLLKKLMWGVLDRDGQFNVGERGICVRPRNLKRPEYKADIAAFIDRIVGYSNS